MVELFQKYPELKDLNTHQLQNSLAIENLEERLQGIESIEYREKTLDKKRFGADLYQGLNQEPDADDDALQPSVLKGGKKLAVTNLFYYDEGSVKYLLTLKEI